MHGRLGGRAGSGTAALTEPELTPDEHAMVCTSKDRDWTVKRRVPEPIGVAPPSSGMSLGTVRVSVNGKGATRITRSI
jgi:hypothetical protein